MTDEQIDGWRKWTNHALLVVASGLFTALILMVIWAATTIKEQSSKDMARLEGAIEKHSQTTNRVIGEQGKKIDTLCQKVGEHDTLLRIPYEQRKQFFTFPNGSKKALE